MNARSVGPRTTIDAPPTPRQIDVLRYVADFIDANHISPQLREICDAFGWSSTNAAQQQLIALQRRGLLVRQALLSRSAHLTPEGLALIGRKPREFDLEVENTILRAEVANLRAKLKLAMRGR